LQTFAVLVWFARRAADGALAIVRTMFGDDDRLRLGQMTKSCLGSEPFGAASDTHLIGS
jgi:hypothetical protein